MKIIKKVIKRSFIDNLNSHLDKISYKDSLCIFRNEDPILYELVRKNMSSNIFFKKIIKKNNCYIVFRMVKKNDTKRSLEAHFDNYLKTYFIPLKVPKNLNSRDEINLRGDLYLWENARDMPRSLIFHACTKVIFQNKYISKLIRYFFHHKFKRAVLEIGDVLYFNGFTTFHYTSLVSSEHRSLVIHTDMPFDKSRLMKLIDWYSRYRTRH